MNEKDNNPGKSLWPRRIRIIALVLALLLAGELVASNAVSLRFSSGQYAGTDYEEAADYIEQNDDYLNAGTLQRMRAVTELLGKPETYDQFSLFASVAIADQDYAKAVEYLNSAIPLFTGADKDLAVLYIKVGCLEALQNKWRDASESLKKGIALDPENPSGHLMLCESFLNLGDYEKALDELTAYSSMTRLSDEELDALIQLQLNLEKYDEALETCTLAEIDGGYSPSAIDLYRAQIFFMQEDYEAARLSAEKSRDAGSDTTAADLLIALCYENLENYPDALRVYLELIDGGAADLTVYQQAAQDAYLTGDFSTAVRISEDALSRFEESPDTLDFNKWIGLSCFETGDYEKAEKNLTAMLDSGEALPELNYLRGICEMAKEEYEAGILDFTAALNSEELRDEALYNRALCLLQTEKADEAAADFQEIIDRNHDPEILALVCELLNISEEELDAARTMNTENKQAELNR